MRISPRTVPILLLSLLGACSSDANPGDDDPRPDAPPTEDAPEPEPDAPPAVYILSNEADANRVVVYERAANGALQASSAYATGGKGSANGLGSQGALIFDAETKQFLAVNAGDHTLSLLALNADGSLTSLDTEAANGKRPISVARRGELVYVVNAGDATTPANISGFRIAGSTLAPIASSSRPLSAAEPAPAQIDFSPSGDVLVVTEKGTNKIVTYAMANQLAAAPNVQDSIGQTPFGFTWSAQGHLVVTEAFGGGVGLGAASSYAIAADGTLTAKTPSIKSTQAAPCWVVIANGRAYATNTASDTISSYTVAADGTLTLDHADGIAATATDAPADADTSDGDGFLYVLNTAADVIGIYAIGADGALTRMPDLTGVAASSVGIVAR
jgi:6-phosphogluconolactonase (cycloisomerase 2 family)